MEMAKYYGSLISSDTLTLLQVKDKSTWNIKSENKLEFKCMWNCSYLENWSDIFGTARADLIFVIVGLDINKQ